MLVTMPFMWRVVSVHRLYTAMSSGPAGAMSCSTVSEVKTAISPERCACMSCPDKSCQSASPGVPSSSMHFSTYEHSEITAPFLTPCDPADEPCTLVGLLGQIFCSPSRNQTILQKMK
jgi:hypothetical protein